MKTALTALFLAAVLCGCAQTTAQLNGSNAGFSGSIGQRFTW